MDQTEAFESYLSNLPAKFSSVQVLQRIIQSEWLRYDEIVTNPERFFEFHEILSRYLLPELGIRFTVQYNLFGGTVYALGSDKQRSFLQELQKQGTLGCFALTESNAGVMSGLLVSTTAEYYPATDDQEEYFLLNTLPGDPKVYISQGTRAQYGVVVADLRMGCKQQGPHCFLVKLRDDDDNFVSGIVVEEIGPKTSLADLDLAKVELNGVKLPVTALLSKYTQVINGEYCLNGIDKYDFMFVAQRLLTGRLCIALSCYNVLQTYVDRAKELMSRRLIQVGPKRQLTQNELPYNREYLRSLDIHLRAYEAYLNQLKTEFCEVLRTESPPSENLIERVAIAKVNITDYAREEIYRLKERVGSRSLLAENLFDERLDVFYCYQFAEGANQILQQKMVRDHLKTLSKQWTITTIYQSVYNYVESFVPALYPPYYYYNRMQAILYRLASKLSQLSRDERISVWLELHEDIYKYAKSYGNWQIYLASEDTEFIELCQSEL